MTTLAERIVAVEAALADAEIPHAFGGALALAYHTGEPRATVDIDVNLFVPATDVQHVFASLPEGVRRDDTALAAVGRDGQVRLFWDRTPLDLFFAEHELHVETARHIERVPFGSDTITVLSATHLSVFKALFDREKDWLDIGEMLAYGDVDRQRVRQWLETIVGADDQRLQRWDERCRTADERGAENPAFRLP